MDVTPWTTATTLLALLRERRLGAVELLDMQLAQIEQHNPVLNAVVALDAGVARREAQAADNAAPGSLGLLQGLSMTLKDSWEAVGMPTTCGLPDLAQHYPARDADAVTCLRAAGAIVFGKTNLPVLAGDHQSYNPVYGTTLNPWDITRTPGGSSGGAAAAVAAGFTSLEMGSDIGGSIRCPAHYCGIYGHKASYGIVPMRGHIPPMPGSAVLPPLGVAGPMARSAADLELALDIIAAPPEAMRSVCSLRLPPSRHETLRGFRVALWADQKAYSVDNRCVAAMHDYAADLRRLGVQVDENARPEIDTQHSDDLYVALLFRAVSADMPEALLALTEQAALDADAGPHSYPTRIACAVRLGFADYIHLLEQQQRLCEVWQRFFKRYDLILCPIMPTVAFPHDHSGTAPGHIAQYTRTTLVDGRPVPYMNGLQWPGLATVANLPATAVPTGRRIDGLPMGLQIIGPYLEDRSPLRFAQLVERELGGFVAPPLS